MIHLSGGSETVVYAILYETRTFHGLIYEDAAAFSRHIFQILKPQTLLCWSMDNEENVWANEPK